MAKYNHILVLIGFYFVYLLTGFNTASKRNSMVSDSLKDQCIQKLREVMNTQSKFVKVHAAEYLLWSGHPEGVRETFMKEEQQFDSAKPYRIGIWRVLAQADSNAKEKAAWIGKIMNVFADIHATDRINAAETLAKLGISPSAQYPDITRRAIESSGTSLSLYSLWAASVSGKDSLNECRHKVLDVIQSNQSDTLQTTLAAYILRHIGGINAEEWKMLVNHALSEPVNSSPKVYLLSAAFMLTPKDSIQSKIYNQIKKELLTEQHSPKAGIRAEMAAALAEKGNENDLPILISMLDNKNPLPAEADNADVSAAAAYAILEIGKRN